MNLHIAREDTTAVVRSAPAKALKVVLCLPEQSPGLLLGKRFRMEPNGQEDLDRVLN